MARKLKPYDVSTVENRALGLSIPIKLDREQKDFFARVGSNDYRAPTEAALRKLVEEAIDLLASVTWIPIIEITHHPENGNANRDTGDPLHDERWDKNRCSSAIEVQRSWIARNDAGAWMTASWTHTNHDPSHTGFGFGPYIPDTDALRFARAQPWYVTRRHLSSPDNEPEFKLPYREKSYGTRVCVYVEYTPELWNALMDVCAEFTALNDRLSALVGSDEGRAALVAGAQLALGPAPDGADFGGINVNELEEDTDATT